MMRKEFLQIVFVALFFSIVFTPTCAKGSSLPSTDFSPVDLCLVLDRSGSMAYPMGDDTKIGGAKNASLDIVNALLPHDRVSVISFSNEATTEIGLTSDLAAVRDVISQISPKGGTSFGAGLNAALNQFDERSSSSNTRAIIFMSDGKHNTPPDPIPYIEDCKKKNIPIFTVGFASNESDIDVGNLTMMSQGTGGQYVFASDLFQLENAFLRLGHQASNWDKIAEYMGKVSPESTALAGSFNVAAYVGYLRVTLNWPGSDMDLRLFDPSGNEVDIKSPNVTYSGDTKPKYFIIKDPQQGNWTAMVYGKDLNFAEEYYLLASEYKSPIQDTKNSTVTPYSEKISGTGSLKKDYYVLNKANDYAKVSVDIENAAYYEYTYKIYSDEIQCIANLDLVVGHAESITCSGDARNRNNIPANLTTLIKNGNLTYNNSVVASNQGVQASQNITKASGDNIGAIGIAHGENNIMLANIIAANRSECFQSTQKVSIGRDTLTYAFVNAITGPLKVSSYIVGGDRRLNATADVAAGVASIDQLVNLTEALQDFKGVIGGANFDTMIKNANGNKTHVYTSVGSGNLVNLSQRASGKDADYTTEYEYMPTSYSTGVYDVAYMEGSSDIFSNRSLANRVIADHCEHMKIVHRASLNEDPLINTSANAIAGPLKVSSHIVGGDRRLNATADVAAGVASIDQLVNLTEARQDSNGVIGGGDFDTVITNVDRKISHAHTAVGSGNLINLSQFSSLKDARYRVKYEYMPTSYQTGTYDTNLNSSMVERN